eukprot:6193422-Pleurochrysis_carterae.AAC.1
MRIIVAISLSPSHSWFDAASPIAHSASHSVVQAHPTSINCSVHCAATSELFRPTLRDRGQLTAVQFALSALRGNASYSHHPHFPSQKLVFNQLVCIAFPTKIVAVGQCARCDLCLLGVTQLVARASTFDVEAASQLLWALVRLKVLSRIFELPSLSKRRADPVKMWVPGETARRDSSAFSISLREHIVY